MQKERLLVYTCEFNKVCGPMWLLAFSLILKCNFAVVLNCLKNVLLNATNLELSISSATSWVGMIMNGHIAIEQDSLSMLTMTHDQKWCYSLSDVKPQVLFLGLRDKTPAANVPFGF